MSIKAIAAADGVRSNLSRVEGVDIHADIPIIDCMHLSSSMRAERLVVLFSLAINTYLPTTASAEEVLRLLEQKECEYCQLDNSDLVYAFLSKANLRGAQLKSANLSGALLNGANLSGSNLSFANLYGASLRNADLRGAILKGADLRTADLNGALFDGEQLAEAHWSDAKGINPSQFDFSALQRAGELAYEEGRYQDAEHWFGYAIKESPDAALSWMSRGLSRFEQGNNRLARQDLLHASQLFLRSGNGEMSEKLKLAAEQLTVKQERTKGGNGAGIKIINGVLSALKMAAPIAVKALGSL